MSRPRLLVVDDKPTFLSLFEKIIDGRMDLFAAQSAAKALALLEIERFDVVVTDVRMPGMDGVDLLRQIKARTPDVEVILVTAYGEIPSAVRAMKEGAFDYLTKPFDPDEVLAVIEQALEARRARPPEVAPAPAASGAESSHLVELSYREAIDVARDRFSRDYLVELLRACQGNVTRAAQRARVERESFHRLMRRFHLRAEDFRDKT